MLDHHIQRTIVSQLSSVDSATFTVLKPTELDNKLFTYHLKGVIREGLVEKIDNGTYRLTNEGKKSWRRSSHTQSTITNRARSILFLIIRDTAGSWLLYKRNTHPLKDKIGFMHAFPSYEEAISNTAQRVALQLTGLSCEFRVAGSGFFRTFDNDTLESFTNFTILFCDDATGNLDVTDSEADYFWVKNPDFSSTDMLPNMKLLTDAYETDIRPFFIDESVSLRS